VLAGHHREEQLPVPLPPGHLALPDPGQRQDTACRERGPTALFSRAIHVPDGNAGSRRPARWSRNGPGSQRNNAAGGGGLAWSRIATCGSARGPTLALGIRSVFIAISASTFGWEMVVRAREERGGWDAASLRWTVYACVYGLVALLLSCSAAALLLHFLTLCRLAEGIPEPSAHI
jgi:hypothetical protein